MHQPWKEALAIMSATDMWLETKQLSSMAIVGQAVGNMPIVKALIILWCTQDEMVIFFSLLMVAKINNTHSTARCRTA